MDLLQKDGPEEIVYKGKIIEVVKQPMKVGDKKLMFEVARRSPGTRLIILKDQKILITKEFRAEINRFDYRLPGGKVFDTLDEYESHLLEDMVPHALEAAKRECRQEVGLIIKNIKHFATAQAGATVVWDLLYFIVDDFEENKSGQELDGEGESITSQWKTYDEVKELCKLGLISEDRSVGILFRFFLQSE